MVRSVPGVCHRDYWLAGILIERKQVGIALDVGAEVEKPQQRTGLDVERITADLTEAPIVLDEPQNRGLIVQGVVDVIGLGPGRDDEQRQARAIAAAIVGSAAG